MTETKDKPVVTVGERGMELRDTTDLGYFADLVLRENLAPKGLQTRGQVIIALQAGLEVGLKPLQSLAYVAVINNRACIWGEGAKGLVEASGELEEWEEGWAVDREDVEGGPPSDIPANEWPDSLEAWTILGRKGGATVTRSFSVADAKRAKLWGKSGPWTQYPQRMLRVRSMAWAMRDLFADALGGLAIREEVEDHPEPRDATATMRSVDEVLGAGEPASSTPDAESPAPGGESDETAGPDLTPEEQRLREEDVEDFKRGNDLFPEG